MIIPANTAAWLYNRAAELPVSSTTGLQFSTGEIGWCALGTSIAITVLASLVVVLRWYTRAVVAQCVGSDDVIILVSLGLSWTMCIILGLEYNEGFGSYDITEVDAEHLTKLIIANNGIWCLATNVTKASILAQYLRIFANPALRYGCAFIMSLLVLSASWGVFAGIFLCQPTEKLWMPELPGHCLDALLYWISAAGVNSALDLIVLILPLPYIVTLHIPYRQKVCICTLFLLGFFVFLISIIRFTTVYIEASRGDHIKSGMYAILWSAIEVNIGIICASLIAFKPLLADWFPALLEQSAAPSFFTQRSRTWFGHREMTLREPDVTISFAPRVVLPSTPPESNSDSSRRATLKGAGVRIRDFGSEGDSEHS